MMIMETTDARTKMKAAGLDINITDASLDLFIRYAKDAGNWGGSPMVGGNVRGSLEANGNLTQLKKAGLIRTFRSDGCDWVKFTGPGDSLAALLGIELY